MGGVSLVAGWMHERPHRWVARSLAADYVRASLLGMLGMLTSPLSPDSRARGLCARKLFYFDRRDIISLLPCRPPCLPTTWLLRFRQRPLHPPCPSALQRAPMHAAVHRSPIFQRTTRQVFLHLCLCPRRGHRPCRCMAMAAEAGSDGDGRGPGASDTDVCNRGPLEATFVLGVHPMFACSQTPAVGRRHPPARMRSLRPCPASEPPSASACSAYSVDHLSATQFLVLVLVVCAAVDLPPAWTCQPSGQSPHPGCTPIVPSPPSPSSTLLLAQSLALIRCTRRPPPLPPCRA